MNRNIEKHDHDSPVEEAAKIYVFKFRARVLTCIILAVLWVIVFLLEDG